MNKVKKQTGQRLIMPNDRYILIYKEFLWSQKGHKQLINNITKGYEQYMYMEEEEEIYMVINIWKD